MLSIVTATDRSENAFDEVFEIFLRENTISHAIFISRLLQIIQKREI